MLSRILHSYGECLCFLRVEMLLCAAAPESASLHPKRLGVYLEKLGVSIPDEIIQGILEWLNATFWVGQQGPIEPRIELLQVMYIHIKPQPIPGKVLFGEQRLYLVQVLAQAMVLVKEIAELSLELEPLLRLLVHLHLPRYQADAFPYSFWRRI